MLTYLFLIPMSFEEKITLADPKLLLKSWAETHGGNRKAGGQKEFHLQGSPGFTIVVFKSFVPINMVITSTEIKSFFQ